MKIKSQVLRSGFLNGLSSDVMCQFFWFNKQLLQIFNGFAYDLGNVIDDSMKIPPVLFLTDIIHRFLIFIF